MLSEPNISYKPFWGICRPLNSWRANSPNPIQIYCAYILPAFTNGIQGFFRGIGDLKITLISSLVNMTVRVIVAAPLVFSLHLGIEALPYSYLAGWIGMLMAELPLLIRTYKAYE